MDGKGYPDGKQGEEVSMGARIVAVADAFDALTSNRPYRDAFSLAKVEEIMRKGAGTQWDAAVIDAFWKIRASFCSLLSLEASVFSISRSGFSSTTIQSSFSRIFRETSVIRTVFPDPRTPVMI